MGAGAAAAVRRRRRRWLVGALGLVVALYAAGSVGLAWRLVHPPRPGPGAATTGSAAEPPLETLRQPAGEDGPEIVVSLLAPDDPAGVVLILHALHGRAREDLLRAVHARGLVGLAVDFRAHGASGGESTTFGIEERREVHAACSLAGMRWRDLPVVAWGESLGAAAVLHALADPGATARAALPRFRGLVLESLYTDLDTAYDDRIRLHLGDWALPFAGGPRWCVRRMLGEPPFPGAGRPVELLARLEARDDTPPILLVGGGRDRHAPPERLAALAAAAPSAEVWTVPDAAHGELYAERHGYLPRVLDHIEALLR